MSECLLVCLLSPVKADNKCKKFQIILAVLVVQGALFSQVLSHHLSTQGRIIQGSKATQSGTLKLLIMNEL